MDKFLILNQDSDIPKNNDVDSNNNEDEIIEKNNEECEVFVEDTEVFVEDTEVSKEDTEVFVEENEVFVEDTEVFVEDTEVFVEDNKKENEKKIEIEKKLEEKDLKELEKDFKKIDKRKKQKTKKEELLIKIFKILNFEVDEIKDLNCITIQRELLKGKKVTEQVLELVPELREVYNSSYLTCLHDNSIYKQKFPVINLVRQILKCNYLLMTPKVISNGYDKASGKKLVTRIYVIEKELFD